MYSAKRRRIYWKGEKIDRMMVFDRDNWTCKLCGDPINPELRFPDTKAATLDHIIPISDGGNHCITNVQAAHYDCNWQKSNA